MGSNPTLSAKIMKNLKFWLAFFALLILVSQYSSQSCENKQLVSLVNKSYQFNTVYPFLVSINKNTSPKAIEFITNQVVTIQSEINKTIRQQQCSYLNGLVYLLIIIQFLLLVFSNKGRNLDEEYK